MEELKRMKIWVLWRLTENRDGKITKIPFAASGGETGTDEKHRATWVTYDEAVEAAKRRNASGVGFVIPEGYFALDIDHVSPDDTFVKIYISRFCSYSELSQSGNGVHIYGKVDLNQLPVSPGENGKPKLDKAFYMKNSAKNLELYIGGITSRFMVFTGNAINDMPVCDCTTAVNVTLDKDMRKAEKRNYSAKRDGESDSDREMFSIIQKLQSQKNGDKFNRLFMDGDFSDYGSQSEADAALCSMIAFRTGDDPEMVDRIFRESALYRPKWCDRRDYRENTIQFGIDSCRGSFVRSKMPHPDFITFENSVNGKVNGALLAKHVRENRDILLVRDNGTQALHTYVYENGVYSFYSTDMLKGLIAGCIAEYDESMVKIADVNEACSLLLTERNTISRDDLNSDENIINFRNGILDLTTMELLPHSPQYLSTVQIPVDWTGRQAPTPEYDRYIYTLTDGNRGVRMLLEQFAGAVLSNVCGYRMKKVLFLNGPGDSGKSQFKALLEMLLGPGNFASVDLKDLEARFGTSMIYGVRLAGSSDMSYMTVSELKTMKKSSGGDNLFAEYKGQTGFAFKYRGLLMFCMNRLPRFGGDDGEWVYNRIMVVNCDNVIPKEKQDKQLLEKLYAEREGIVFRFVTALNDVINNGYRFDEPQCVTSEREHYRCENSTVISFFKECMTERGGEGVSDSCTTTRIYDVYKAWCSRNSNGYCKNARDFRNDLADWLRVKVDDLIVHKRDGNYFRDYTLSYAAKEEYKRFYGSDSLSFT